MYGGLIAMVDIPRLGGGLHYHLHHISSLLLQAWAFCKILMKRVYSGVTVVSDDVVPLGGCGSVPSVWVCNIVRLAIESLVCRKFLFLPPCARANRAIRASSLSRNPEISPWPGMGTRAIG